MSSKIHLAVLLLFFVGLNSSITAQEGQVTVRQDEMIPKLLEIKTELTKETRLGDRYRIQLYSGDNKQASDILKEYRELYKEWPSTIVYETPNYKVWIGKFRNSLAADRALLQVRENFPAAFKFKPEQR